MNFPSARVNSRLVISVLSVFHLRKNPKVQQEETVLLWRRCQTRDIYQSSQRGWSETEGDRGWILQQSITAHSFEGWDQRGVGLSGAKPVPFRSWQAREMDDFWYRANAITERRRAPLRERPPHQLELTTSHVTLRQVTALHVLIRPDLLGSIFLL